ncbi:unnamed protein product [Rotaria sp. Silwood1]|nr:unnamed protein product [Rotaria sp. Silwood1]
MPIEDKNGKLLVNSADQLERWREYFCELLNVSSTVDPCVINEIKITTPSRPRSIGIRKRWEDTVMLDIEALQIRNWRSLTQDRDRWRTAINRNVQTKAVHNNIKEIVFQYKQRAVKRKAKERAEAQGVGSDALQGLLTEQTTGSGEVFDTQLIDSGWRLAEALCKTSCAVFDTTSTAFLKLVDDPSMNEED